MTPPPEAPPFILVRRASRPRKANIPPFIVIHQTTHWGRGTTTDDLCFAQITFIHHSSPKKANIATAGTRSTKCTHWQSKVKDHGGDKLGIETRARLGTGIILSIGSENNEEPLGGRNALAEARQKANGMDIELKRWGGASSWIYSACL